MLRIAACDDEQRYLDDVKRLLDAYCASHAAGDFILDTFTHPFDLVDALDNGTQYDMFLLDIYLPGMTGMALAQELRRNGNHAPIMFLTTSEDYALEAFGVGATQYLVKPIEKQKFFDAMQNAVEKTKSMPNRQIIIKAENGYANLLVCTILYAETNDKVLTLTLTDKTKMRTRMTGRELYEMLSVYPNFVRCGVGYIINLTHVRYLNRKTLTMDDGTTIQIPRRSYQDLRDAYFRYFCERSE